MANPHPDENLTAYLAGELTETEKQEVQEHLRVCVECSQQLHRLRSVNALLDQVDSLAPSKDFSHKLMKQIGQSNRILHFSLRKTIAWAALAAAIAFIVLILKLQHPSVPVVVTHRVKPPAVQNESPTVTPMEPYNPRPTPSKEPSEPAAPQLSVEDAELVAHLDEVEDLDLIANYDNIQGLEDAVLASGAENLR